MDLLPGWDQLALEAVAARPGAILSHFVENYARVEQRAVQHRGAPALEPPWCVSPRFAMLVPDYRLVVGAPTQLEKLVDGWFDSFWAGLLTAVAVAPAPVEQLAVPLAVEPRDGIGAETYLHLERHTASTLLAWFLHTGAHSICVRLLSPQLLGNPALAESPLSLRLPAERRRLEEGSIE